MEKEQYIIDEGSVFNPMSGHKCINITNQEEWVVCKVFGKDFKELKERSNIIAAAPEMLSMLNKCLPYTKDWMIYHEIEELIKKATGHE